MLSFADRKDMEKFHDALKTIDGPKSSAASSLLSADGSTFLHIKMLSWKCGQGTRRSLVHQLSMTMLSTVTAIYRAQCSA